MRPKWDLISGASLNFFGVDAKSLGQRAEGTPLGSAPLTLLKGGYRCFGDTGRGCQIALGYKRSFSEFLERRHGKEWRLRCFASL